jgi:hypothetical protein
MRGPIIPSKTPAGQRELALRARGLSQRHRTVLLLVDGRRSLAEVLRTAEAAGASRQVFDELLQMGMVALPVDPALQAAADTAAGPITDIELPLDIPADTSLLPPAQSLLPASDWVAMDSLPGDASLTQPMDEARALMIRAVRREAPVAGSLTVMKLMRARTREDLLDLLDEVEQRLARPRRLIVAAQTMRHVRHLLSMAESTASVPGA